MTTRGRSKVRGVARGAACTDVFCVPLCKSCGFIITLIQSWEAPLLGRAKPVVSHTACGTLVPSFGTRRWVVCWLSGVMRGQSTCIAHNRLPASVMCLTLLIGVLITSRRRSLTPISNYTQLHTLCVSARFQNSLFLTICEMRWRCRGERLL